MQFTSFCLATESFSWYLKSCVHGFRVTDPAISDPTLQKAQSLAFCPVGTVLSFQKNLQWHDMLSLSVISLEVRVIKMHVQGVSGVHANILRALLSIPMFFSVRYPSSFFVRI
jgi:hypothetical protein